METVLILISALLLFAVLALLSMGGALFSIVCSRRGKLVSKVLADGEKQLMEKYGDKIKKGAEKFSEIPQKEVSIKSFDNLTLHGYLLEGKNHDRTIICVHGYHSSPQHDFGPAAYKLLECADLLFIDQRAHGKSEGKYITLGIKESRDCKAWAEYILKEKGEDHPVYLDGVSMGGTTVLLASSLDLPKNIKGIIADCGFSSPMEILKNITGKFLKTNTDVLLLSTDIYCKLFAKFSLKEMDTAKAMQNNRLPVLFAHGMCDELVPYQMTKDAYDACTTPKFLVLSKDADHGTSYMVDFEKYSEAIENLFIECESAS